MNANKIHLIGRVGKDATFRSFPSGGGVLSFSLATSERWKDKKTGEKKERTDWHNIEVFGKLAEAVQTYVTKGKAVYVEGRLGYDRWKDKNDIERITAKVRVDSLQLLSSPRDGGGRRDDVGQGPGEDRDEAPPSEPFQASDEDVPW